MSIKRTRKTPSKSTTTVDFLPEGDKQLKLVEGIKNNKIIFATGCAGTGKTLVAIACALNALFKKEVSKIVLIRPAVEAGPSVGFLPGTLDEKIGPFMVPCLDAMYKLLPDYIVDSLLENEQVQIVSLAYSRGLNFEDAIVVCDEAENLDRKSMFLLLTRICPGSKLIFSGDVAQTDLPGRTSGLQEAIDLFTGEENFFVIRFSLADVKRDDIVKTVIKKYYPYEKE